MINNQAGDSCTPVFLWIDILLSFTPIFLLELREDVHAHLLRPNLHEIKAGIPLRKLHIHSVKPGDVNAKTIMTENGNVLLGAGLTLTQRFIDRLKAIGIDTLYIEDAFTADIIPEDVIRDQTRSEAVESVHHMMSAFIHKPSFKGRSAVPDIGETLKNVFGTILSDLMSRKDVMVNLSNMHVMDGYLFHHSVNVAVLAGILGISKGYNQAQLTDLGVGALLFDIGMTMVPKEILDKQDRLNEEDIRIVHKHTEDGFNLLRNQHSISLLSAHCALQHHERFNGTGYPRGLKGNEIHDFAQIVAIADVYDALTSSRIYRQRYSPSEAIEFLFAAGNNYFDLDLIRLFCKHISIYPISSTVVLNTGQIGVVSKVTPLAVHRPIVRIIADADGKPVSSPYEVDLYEQHNLTVVKTL